MTLRESEGLAVNASVSHHRILISTEAIAGPCTVRFRPGLLCLFALFCLLPASTSAADRSVYLPYDTNWMSGPVSKWIALDTIHQQIFTAWPFRDRVDVLSTVDYHLIRSINVASPSTLDISPDGTTLAVGTSSSHILFFDTGTFGKTNDVVFPDAALGISAFLYTANGNGMIRAEKGLSTGGGITAYWNHASNSFQNISFAGAISPTAYSATGPMARSGDYTKIMLGDASSRGEVQVIDGNTGQIIWDTGAFGFQGYIYSLAANRDASRYAVCAQTPGSYQTLVILNSTFDEIFQDNVSGCLGITFSADGTKLYRDVYQNSTSYTQLLDMTSFSAKHVPNFFTSLASNWRGFPTFWQAADASGMLYGVNSDISTTIGAVVWIGLDTTATTAPQIPSADYQLQILRVVDNVGSPQGGDTIRLLCTGVYTSASVSVGGRAATNVQLTAPGAPSGSIYITAQTPPGTPGFADVTVTSSGGSATASKAFQYAASRTIIPFATSPNYLLYDPLRNRLYASHKDQVEVIDVATKTLLEPLIPAGGKLTNSQFAGLSLSPDNNRLYIADFGAGRIHILNLANPGTGSSIDPGGALGLSTPITPGRVFELSNGMLIGTGTNTGISPPAADLFLVDPVSQTGQWVQDADGNSIKALVWNTTNHGEKALLNGAGAAVAIWSVNSATNAAPADETAGYQEATANEDGTIISTGGSTPGFNNGDPEVFDFNPYSIGYIREHSGAPTPSGTASFFLDPTGALLYKAGLYEVNGGNCLCGSGLPNGGVEIDDMHLFQSAEKIAFPEAFVTSYSPFTDHQLTADPTGRYLFGVTQSGITIMQLYSVPLSIGNVRPAVLDAQSTTLTVRGTGFVSGAEVTIGGAEAATTYVDANTLMVAVPQVAPGWQDVTVSLPGGATYTASAMLQVAGNQPTPVISGFSPASVTVQSGIAGFDESANVTVLGSNFDVRDTVEINGRPVASAFLDSSHMAATIPSTLTGQTGSISVSIVSPYAGSSNSFALPMINPVPAPQDNAPISFGLDSPLNLSIYGTGFVAGSIIRWNGQNLPTYLEEGETSSGLELLSATVPGNLTQLNGNATVTVYNPPPGGGVSPAITATLGLQPVPVYTLFGPNNALIANYFSVPPSIDFGTQVLNTTTTLSLVIQSRGSVGYGVSSIVVSGGAFSTTVNACPTLGQNSACDVPLTFAPTATGFANGTLSVVDNLPGSPHSIPLTSNAIQTPVPVVSITNINALDQTITARFQGKAVVGGPQIPVTAWIEYGTDQSLSTYAQSATVTFTGDGLFYADLTQLTPNTLYAARIAVQTSGGIGRSPIRLFATIAAPAWLVISPAPGGSDSATITAGKTATYSLVAVGSGSGYVGIASLTCTGFPPGATCTVNPSQVSIGPNPSPFTVMVTTTAAQVAAERRPGPSGPSWPLSFAFAVAIIANRKRWRHPYILLFSILLTLACASCGGGGSGSTGGGGMPPMTATPPGSYSLTINGTTGGVQISYSLVLTVK